MDNIEKETLNITKDKNYMNIKKIIIEMAIYLAISIIIIFIMRTFFIQHVKVSGTSMEPTLADKQHLLIDKVSYKFKEIKRYDIIVFRPYVNEKNLFYIKRVIGLPGEKVKIENNIIYINDKPLNESYGRDTYTDAKIAREEIQLGANDYFVLGDNREVSKDSREKEIGLLTKELIIGKAMYCIYPFERAGFIKSTQR